MRGLLVVAAIGSGCATPDPHHALLPYAIEAAAKAHQPLVVEFSAVWCKPCEVFASKVLPDPRVTEALRHVFFVSYDVDTIAGQDAQRRCRIRGVPAVVGIDRKGFVRLMKTGTEPTADEFLVFLRQAQEVLGDHR